MKTFYAEELFLGLVLAFCLPRLVYPPSPDPWHHVFTECGGIVYQDYWTTNVPHLVPVKIHNSRDYFYCVLTNRLAQP